MKIAAGLGPPVFSSTPWWIGFWVTTAVILVVVALVGAITMLVNRIEWQAASTVMGLSVTKDAATPLANLPTANRHLNAVGKTILQLVSGKENP